MLLGLGSTLPVQSQIISTAQQFGVDPNLALAVAKQESGYQQTGPNGQTLTSSAGALGVMQLMPATAAGLGVNPNDQSQNIAGGVKLLQQLLQQFNGDVPKALAAYNAGPGAVQKYGGVPPYPETQNYVSSIMANYQSMGGSDTAPVSQPAITDTSGDTSTGITDTSLFPVASSPLDSSSSIDLSDPTTLAAVGIAAAAVAYLVFG